jgi:membrane associated rhomboid family serine protease
MMTKSIRFGGPLTPMVVRIMIANAAVFLFVTVLSLFSSTIGRAVVHTFALSHEGLAHQFKVWQLFTYMFLHVDFFHVFMNLFGLWMFSGDLEERWGGGNFLKYYIISGIGAGICIALMNVIIYDAYGVSPLTMGASGALYAVLLAYGLTWPNREVLLWFVLPVKMKYLVIFFGLVEFFGSINMASGAGGNVSHIGHLGGIITGFIYLKFIMDGGGEQGGRPGIITQIMRKRKLEQTRKRIERRNEAKRIIDELLEKIARQGMSSLTAAERKKLDWARKHYFPDRNETIH